MFNFFVLAAEVAPDGPAPVTVIAEAVKDQSWWPVLAIAAGSMLFAKLVSWIASWLDTKGQELVKKELAELHTKINATGVGAQIQADDALFNALEAAIPDVFATLSKDLQAALLDAKLSKEEVFKFAGDLWAAAKPHIEGGAHDYLKNSSFSDGRQVAEMILRRWIAKRQLAKGVSS